MNNSCIFINISSKKASQTKTKRQLSAMHMIKKIGQSIFNNFLGIKITEG